MSGGPRRILVKRKRDDEDLPEALMRENDLIAFRDGTYDRTHVAIWRLAKKRKSAEPLVPQTTEKASFGVEALHISAPGDEKWNPYALASLNKKHAQENVARKGRQPARAGVKGDSVDATEQKFYLLGRSAPPSGPLVGKRKRDFLVFERRVRWKELASEPGQPRGPTVREAGEDAIDIVETATLPERKLKKPTLSAREKQWRKDNWKNARDGRDKKAQDSDTMDEIISKKKPEPDEQPVQLEKYYDLAQQLDAEKEAQDALKQQSMRGATMNSDEAQDEDAMDIDQPNSLFDMDSYNLEHVPIHDASVQILSIEPLVIPESDEPLWELYASGTADDEDDKEFETDDEDSNAEDYYGADYPEDELSEDDEFDAPGAAYRHRRYGSDKEEFDAEEDDDDDIHSGDEPDMDDLHDSWRFTASWRNVKNQFKEYEES